MSPAIEEILYPAMEDFRLDIIIGSGPAAQTVKIDLPRFTLIGATTRAGMLSNPLRERFGMHFRMQFYNHKELASIVYQASCKLDKPTIDSASIEIAKRSRGTPRVALRLLKRVRDFAEVEDRDKIELDITQYALNELGVNNLGFDEQDIKFLELLISAKGKPIGLSTIGATLSEDEGTIEEIIEPYLIANGYIERTARGRVATLKSYEHFRLQSPQEEENPFEFE
jgi:Holliday junction DNA helicase RuvB